MYSGWFWLYFNVMTGLSLAPSKTYVIRRFTPLTDTYSHGNYKINRNYYLYSTKMVTFQPTYVKYISQGHVIIIHRLRFASTVITVVKYTSAYEAPFSTY